MTFIFLFLPRPSDFAARSHIHDPRAGADCSRTDTSGTSIPAPIPGARTLHPL